MQAMRPVFSDLLQDLQRSIGYYQTLHRNTELSLMVGLGSTFRIPGLRKFLGQQLQIQVLRLDEFKKISVTGREAASFAAVRPRSPAFFATARSSSAIFRIWPGESVPFTWLPAITPGLPGTGPGDDIVC